jgi:hypothetical protein
MKPGCSLLSRLADVQLPHECHLERSGAFKDRPGLFPGGDAGLFAIEILAQCPGGGWRTLNEWKAMFGAVGFCLQALHGVGASMHLMVWQRNQSA